MTFLARKPRITVQSVARLALLGLVLSSSATLVQANEAPNPTALATAIDANAELLNAAKAGDLAAVQAAIAKGADVNYKDASGVSALHLALETLPAAPKPKKKSGFGGMLGSLGGALAGGALGNLGGNLGGALGNLGASGLTSALLGNTSIDSLLGGGNLQALLGGSFNLGGQGGWQTILGLALKGDSASKGAFGLGNVLGNNLSGLKNGLQAGDWVNLLGAVKGADSRALDAMQNLSGGVNNANWSQFIQMASSGNEEGVAKLMSDPQMASLLQTATQGLNSAAQSLPGQSSRSIVSLLLEKGANSKEKDAKGRTAEKLAKERGLDLKEMLAGE